MALYRKEENDDRRNHLTEVCAPYLRNETTSDQYARQAIMDMDGSDVRSGILVEGIMEKVAADFGQPLADEVRRRINAYGQSVDYSKVDLMKFIDLGKGAGPSAYLKTQCDAL